MAANIKNSAWESKTLSDEDLRAKTRRRKRMFSLRLRVLARYYFLELEEELLLLSGAAFLIVGTACSTTGLRDR